MKVLKVSDIFLHLPPKMSPPTVALELPRSKLMKTIVEKMAKICKYVYLTAAQTGRLVLRAEHSSTAVIKTFFNGKIMIKIIMEIFLQWKSNSIQC